MKELIKRFGIRKNVIIGNLLGILMFIILIGFGIYENRRIGEYEETFMSTEFDEIVLDVYQRKRYLYVHLNNIPKRVQIENSYNYGYEDVGSGLNSIMKHGDRIIKRKCSDTLIVIKGKGGSKYHYLIGDRLYNNKERSKEFIEKYNKQRRIVTTNNDCK